MAAAHQQQLELARQQAEAALQEQQQAHIREATSVLNQVKQEAERVLSKEFQEIQNMENQDTRVSARIQAEKIREEILNMHLIPRIDQRQKQKQGHLRRKYRFNLKSQVVVEISQNLKIRNQIMNQKDHEGDQETPLCQ